MDRRFGEFAGIWRLGIQQRGAWHFHALLFVPPSFGPIKELRSFVASSWYEACGKVSEGHLLAGTHVEEVRTWRKATSWERYEQLVRVHIKPALGTKKIKDLTRTLV